MNDIKNIFKNKVVKSDETQQIEQLPDYLDFLVGDEENQQNSPEISMQLDDVLQEPIDTIDSTFAQDTVETDQIVVPKSIAEIQYDNTERDLEVQRLAQEKIKRANLRNFNKVNSSKKEEINQQLITEFQEVNPGEDVSDVDMIKVQSQVNEIINEIPDLVEDSITDFVIEPRKDKTGYIKEKVSIRSALAPKELSMLASVAKNESNGAVRHRVADIRLIGNTNKTQLKSFDLKLMKETYTFKPLGGSMDGGVNKSTRVMISVSPDFVSTKKLIVYIQNSRDKFVIEYEIWDNEDIQWLGKFIANFFKMTFANAERFLKFKNNDDPLVPVITKIIKTNDYKVMPLGKDQKIHGFVIESRGSKNQWLLVVVRPKVNKQGEFGIFLNSRVDKSWGHEIKLKSNTPITLKYLMSTDFVERLYDIYNDDWSKYGVNQEAEETKELFMVNKLTYRVLKAAFYELFDSAPELEVKIGGTLSRKDTAETLKKDYQAEAIVGKTKHLDYFVLSYSAVKISGGNARKTVDDRNTDSRVYMFQLEYSADEQTGKFLAKTFQEIKDTTKFLTNKPEIINQ